MAYLPARRPLDDQGQTFQPASSGPTSSAGGGQAVGTGPTTAPAPTSFPGIRAYFDVNRDQAAAMGQGLIGDYETEAKKAQDAAAERAKLPFLDAQPPPGYPKYQPPPGFVVPDPVTPAREAARLGSALSDPAGRAALLSAKYGAGGGYTPGMASFDAALVGGAGWGPVQGALDKWSGVVGQLQDWKPGGSTAPDVPRQPTPAGGLPGAPPEAEPPGGRISPPGRVPVDGVPGDRERERRRRED